MALRDLKSKFSSRFCTSPSQSTISPGYRFEWEGKFRFSEMSSIGFFVCRDIRYAMSHDSATPDVTQERAHKGGGESEINLHSISESEDWTFLATLYSFRYSIAKRNMQKSIKKPEPQRGKSAGISRKFPSDINSRRKTFFLINFYGAQHNKVPLSLCELYRDMRALRGLTVWGWALNTGKNLSDTRLFVCFLLP